MELQRLLLTSREAAEMLCISERTLFSWTKQGLLQKVQVGRTVRYHVEELKRFIERQIASSTNEPSD